MAGHSTRRNNVFQPWTEVIWNQSRGHVSDQRRTEFRTEAFKWETFKEVENAF